MADPSDNAVRDLAHTILARPEYDNAHVSAPANWLASIMRRLFEWLGKFELLHEHAPALYWLVWGALLLIFILLLVHIVWTISIALRAPELPEPLARSNHQSDPRGDAERLAASGNYLAAAHVLMIASFRNLAENAVIELRPDRSNRWIRRALLASKLNSKLAREIDGLIERTERHWFGDREENPAIYSQWRSAFEAVTNFSR